MATGSARSVTGYDIYQAIEKCSDLLENFGGHMYAAGATFKMPFNQAKKHLLQTIQKVYPDLGQP